MRAPSNGIEIEYETFGDAGDPPLLLVMGLGAQMISWDDEFCESLVDRGFFVIRFDNRDVGLSTKVDVGDLDVDDRDHEGHRRWRRRAAPYLLADMADDAVGLLDHLGIDRAHIVGASMGGMIAQTIAIDHPERVLSLTSIMSTTGDPDVGQPNPEVAAAAARGRARPSARPTSPTPCAAAAHRQPRALRRGRAPPPRPAGPSTAASTRPGMGHQLLAILSSPSRSDGLRHLDINTLVIHGDVDPLVNVSGGERTAEVIPGAELLILEGMGHDLPAYYWPQVIEAITSLASRSAATA